MKIRTKIFYEMIFVQNDMKEYFSLLKKEREVNGIVVKEKYQIHYQQMVWK